MGQVCFDDFLFNLQHFRCYWLIADQMKVSFEILEARLMHEINQLKEMIYVLLPNKPANFHHNSHSYGFPYNQPVFHQSFYPTSANSYEETTRQTTYGSQNSNQPLSDNLQPTNITPIQKSTTTNSPFRIKTTQRSTIDKPMIASTITTESPYEKTTLIPDVKFSTVGNVTEKILEFKPVQTKSLNRFRSKHNK